MFSVYYFHYFHTCVEYSAVFCCWCSCSAAQLKHPSEECQLTMCKGLSSLPSSCLEKAKEMRVKLSHLAESHKHKIQDGKSPQDLETLLNKKSGLQLFRGFLRSEFSEENLEFWLACEDYRVSPSNLQKMKASSIYSQFLDPDAPQEVNLDAETREALLSLMDSPCADTFNKAQHRIYSLMAEDSFPRFLRSHHGVDAIKAL
ncbi:regulator of G-protein signaling 5 isoform X1 [Brachyistius frenatus]|uniref:regulator of G-protein signaling 5 isoform X1 n=1 Tax=Brachyistius frenatus TaxID=100188 RepID=UPI0037E812C0